MKPLWIDTHIHVSDLGRDGAKRERMVADLAELLDRCDADLRLVVSCDFPYQSRIGTDPAGMVEGNRLVHELVTALPGRLFGACTVNPNYLAESLAMIDLAFDQWGFVMLGEMLQYSHRYRMDSDPAEQVVRRAAHYDVPVQVHIGTYWHKQHVGSTDGMDHLRDLLRCVDRVPEARYILAHAIGCGPTPAFVPWADMILDTMRGLFATWPDNLWVEIRDFHAPALARTLREVPATRLLSGTDWTTRIGPPFASYGTMFDVAEGDNPFPPAVASFVEFLKQAGAADQVIERLAWRNAAELLRLPIAP